MLQLQHPDIHGPSRQVSFCLVPGRWPMKVFHARSPRLRPDILNSVGFGALDAYSSGERIVSASELYVGPH